MRPKRCRQERRSISIDQPAPTQRVHGVSRADFVIGKLHPDTSPAFERAGTTTRLRITFVSLLRMTIRRVLSHRRPTGARMAGRQVEVPSAVRNSSRPEVLEE